MGRFDYLKKADRAAKKGNVLKSAPAPDESRTGGTERLEAVYLRKETVRAVWRQVRDDGGESVSELVEDLLLAWLRERQRP
ncbi:hypothetical protein [Deinococcus sedimenti]|uniref:CopG family transcriptional regulator n=1 Tax=Deinococcus sedimenti TaxID=1867090 RepID=A0ABQ2S418_9DEIO|nr:hypothetical protein [Deinococcus sedimenti]GGR83753.1 hypothetical protein GCM10008960_08510 [Deinococcus sedimenti]